MPDQPPLRIGGRYRIDDQLGSGGMGTVYAATDEATGQKLAVKQLRPSATRNYPRAALLFEREYHTLTQLRHPHIVEAYDYGVTPDGPFYTMELLDGADLHEHSPCPWREVCRIVRDVATALALLHSRRLVHRDVSPRNVRRTSEGRTKLIDFGAMTSMAVSVDLVGTPPFTAPEAFYRQPLDPRVDLFALGALAYWLLTGRHAFPANTFSELPALWKRCPDSPSTLSRDVPPALDEIVRVLLNENALARPRSAAELIERIDVLCGDPHTPEVDVAEGYLATPKLVGRLQELEHLRERLRYAVLGRGSLCVVDGAVGTGRTRLLQELAVEAKLQGAVSLACDASTLLQKPYGVARSLVEEWRRACPDGMSDDVLLREVSLLLSQGGTRDAPATDPRERRARLLSGLRAFFLKASRNRPIVISVDDIHACDEPSVSLLASLAHDTSGHALLIVVSAPTDSVPPALTSAERLHVGALSASDTLELVRSLFGDVPNVTRLAAWVHDRAQGNVLLALELARHLCASGDLRYTGGAWVIAPTLRTGEAPARLEEAFAIRVGALSPGARELAELCALYQGEIQLACCREAWNASCRGPATATRFFAALDELLYAGFIATDEDSCYYRQKGLREAVLQGTTTSRIRELHRHIGESFLLSEGETTANKLNAAWHFLQGGEDERGADLVAEVAQNATAMESMGVNAVPIIEAAFEAFEKLSRPLFMRVHAQRGLLQYAYVHDTRLAVRAAPVLTQLSIDSGLAFAASLPRQLPAAERLQRGMQEAAARYAATPENDRGLVPGEAIVELIRASFAMMGVAVLWYDMKPLEQLDIVLEPLSALGDSSGAAVAIQSTRLLLVAMRGLDRRAGEMRLRLLDMLRDPNCFQDVPAEAREHLIATQLHAQGTSECLLYPERALERARSIDALSLQMYEGAALQIRYLVELCRGHAGLAEEYRRQLERVALQTGFGRQNELWLVRATAGPYSWWGDVLALKQTMLDLEEVAASYPGYRPFYENARAAYHRERGEYDVALEACRTALALAPPGRHGAFLQCASIYMDTLVAAGYFEEALRFAYEHVTSRPIDGIDYGRLDASLAPALAVATAATGDVRGGRERLVGYRNAYAHSGESDLLHVRLYESEARIALIAGDADAFRSSTRALSEHCRALENPALIARCERLVEAARREKLISSPFSSAPGPFTQETRSAAPEGPVTQHATPTAKAR